MKEALRREQLLTLAAIVRADTAAEMRFRFEALQALTLLSPGRDDIDRWSLLAQVEDIGGFRTDDEIISALLEMGVVTQSGEGYSLTAEFSVPSILGETSTAEAAQFGWSLLETLLGRPAAEASGSRGALLAMVGAVRQARLRVAEMWQLIEDGHDPAVAGVTLPPTFWRWEERETGAGPVRRLVPWGNKPSTYTVLDMHRMLLQPLLLMRPEVFGLDEIALGAAVAFASTMLEKTALRTVEMTEGQRAYSVHNDDDYPGAEHPVVPSNAALLISLSLDAEARALARLAVPDRTTVVQHLLGFLIGQQHCNGGWSVFRFENRDGMQVSPTFTALTLRAICLAVRTWPAAVDADAREAIRRAARFIGGSMEHIHVEAGSSVLGVRKGFTRSGAYSAFETLDLAVSALSVPADIGGESFDRVALLEAAMQAIKQWSVLPDSRDNILTVSFQAPYSEGPAPASSTWEQPGHARMLTNVVELIRHHLSSREIRFGLIGSGKVAPNIDMAARQTLGDCVDGCWNDFNLVDCIFPSNMVYNVDCLCSYFQVADLINKGH